jgi:5,10-methylene-tetrahydrofolate dehydrogenase/methenyl tetrahydrofolate cyclohydrolase
MSNNMLMEVSHSPTLHVMYVNGDESYVSKQYVNWGSHLCKKYMLKEESYTVYIKQYINGGESYMSNVNRGDSYSKIC